MTKNSVASIFEDFPRLLTLRRQKKYDVLYSVFHFLSKLVLFLVSAQQTCTEKLPLTFFKCLKKKCRGLGLN